MARSSGPGEQQVEDRLFRALLVLRWVVLANAVGLAVYHRADVVRPAVGVAAYALMVVWTAFASWAYAAARRRTPPLLAADLLVSLVLVVGSPLVKGASPETTLPGFWVMAALLAWAVRFRWQGGLVAGVLLVAADLSVHREVTQSGYGNLFLLLIGGPVVGYLVGSLRRLTAERDLAQQEAAAASERDRLARVVHDGVLQVLALVQRRAGELGGSAGELGRLAGEQEVALRALVQRSATPVPVGDADVSAGLAALGSRPGVTVVTPGVEVRLPAYAAGELLAVVSACLDNVERHVGPGAPAWVLLEALPEQVAVTVRDAGPGIPAGRLAEAAGQGRLGVSQSIRGRVADLGGSATLDTGPGGTSWELRLPRGAT